MQKFSHIGQNKGFAEKYIIAKLGGRFYLLYQFIHTHPNERDKFCPVRLYEVDRRKSYTLKGIITRLKRICEKRNYALIDEDEVKKAFERGMK